MDFLEPNNISAGWVSTIIWSVIQIKVGSKPLYKMPLTPIVNSDQKHKD